MQMSNYGGLKYGWQIMEDNYGGQFYGGQIMEA